MRSLESSAAVAELVADGMAIAVGGAGLVRKPMRLLHALVETGRTELTVITLLGSVDVELLLAAGVATTVHTAGVALDGFGLAPAYRRARQERSATVVEWSEGTLVAGLEAAARRLPSMPATTSPRSDVIALNPHLAVAPDPVRGEPTVYAEAMRPDVALLHVDGVDEEGNLYVGGDAAFDALLARAAPTVVASAERIVPTEPRRAAISRLWVDAYLVAAGASSPTSSGGDTLADLEVLTRWAGSDGSDASLLRSPP